jgi:peptidoglycan/xylan/chitin deacetylase (PgdA/CDA1 family)
MKTPSAPIATPVFLKWILSIVLKWTGIIWVRELFLRDSLRILIFHRIHPTRIDDGMTVSAPVFERQMSHLARHYSMLSLDDTQAVLTRKAAVPARPVAVTFDDGYASNYTLARPILIRYGITATFFLTVGAIDGEMNLWPEQLRLALWAYPGQSLSLDFCGCGTWRLTTDANRYACLASIRERLKTLTDADLQVTLNEILHQLRRSPQAPESTPMLTWDQVREMRKARMTFGAHTVSHKILTKIDLSQARWEIEESKRRIEATLGEPVKHFAYPNGRASDSSSEIEQVLRNIGFQTACTTIQGTNPVGHDPMALRRIDINDCGCLNPLAKFSAAMFDARMSGFFGRWEG